MTSKQEATYTVYTDASHSVDRGEAGISCIIYDASGKLVGGTAKFIPVQSTVEAEAKAVCLAVQSVPPDADVVKLYNDNANVIEFVMNYADTGTIRRKHNKLTDSRKAMEAAIRKVVSTIEDSSSRIVVERIGRENNKIADAIACMALEEKKDISLPLSTNS